MEFRLSRETEYPAIRRLWNQSFGEEEPWTSWYFSRHYRSDQIWVGVENGAIIAQAHLLPYRLMLRGSWRKAVYFVGVCVEEELRGTGIGRVLMATALAELNRANVDFSILQPRWPIFYQKLGWDYTYSRQSYTVRIADAQKQLQDSFPAVNWKADEQEAESIAKLYEAFSKTRHGYALRQRQDWENLLADHRGDGGRVGVVSRNGIPMGYVMYKVLDKVLTVREMIWSEPWVIEAAWEFMIRADLTGIESLAWEDPAGDSETVFYPGSQSAPFLMGRVTNLQAVLASLEYPADLSTEMKLTVSDPLASWNQGTFCWHVAAGKGSLIPVVDDAATETLLDIGTLSQMAFGERSVADLLAANNNNICGGAAQQFLERIFPPCRNFISEYY